MSDNLNFVCFENFEKQSHRQNHDLLVLSLLFYLEVVEAEISQVEAMVGFASSDLHRTDLGLHKLLLALFVVPHLSPSGPCIVDGDAAAFPFAAKTAVVAADVEVVVVH